MHFKGVRYKNLDILKLPKEYLSPEFTERHVNGFYYSWGAAVADVNHDGVPDVIAGPYYYLGPDYTEAHEIYIPTEYKPRFRLSAAIDGHAGRGFYRRRLA